MLMLADQKLVALLSDIRVRVDRDLWQNPNVRYPHLVHHSITEADMLIGFLKPLCELLPEKLTEAEAFVLSAASLLCNVGMQTPISPRSIEDLEHIRRRHAEFSYDYLLHAGSAGYVFLGLGPSSPYLEPIALLCKGHEGLWLDEYQDVWLSIGRLRLDLLAALLQLGSKLATTRALLNAAQLQQVPSQYRIALWSLLYYEGVMFQQQSRKYVLKLVVDPSAWEFCDHINAVVQNPIRETFNQALGFFNRYGLKVQLDRQRISKAMIAALPDDVATYLKLQDTTLVQLVDNLEDQQLPYPQEAESCYVSLQRFLCETFSLSELEVLAFQLGIRFEDLRGDTLPLKAMSLIEHERSRGRFSDLLTRVHNERRIPFTSNPQLVACLENNPTPLVFPRVLPILSMREASDKPLQVEDRVPGRKQYRIVGLVSANIHGNSFVYKAHDEENDRDVAIKEPTFFFSAAGFPSNERDDMRKRFDREIKLLLQMQHSFIVKVHDVIDRRYIVQEWIQGNTLRHHIIHGGLSVTQILTLGAEVCDAMRFAHRTYGFYHRDLKPDNIFRRDDGHACIIDFGLARAPGLINDTNLTARGPIGGTPVYMSPEQSASIDIDQRTDIFALGVTLYELFANQPPYPYGVFNPILYPGGILPQPTPLRQVCTGLTAAIEACIMKAIDLDRSQRFPDWESMYRALTVV